MSYLSTTGTRSAFGDGDVDDTEAPPGDLEGRARAWHATGNPRTLWPSLDPAALPPAAAAIERSVRHLLDGRPSSLGAADGHDAHALGIAALLSGTGPLLGYWVEQGALDVSDATAGVLALHLAHGRRRIDRMTQGVVPALAALAAGGVSPAIIKGFHTAHTHFPEPGVRPMSDVDVVVAADDVDRAERILAAAGFTGDATILRPYKRDWRPDGIDRRLWSVELWHCRGEWKLELHDGMNFALLTRYGVRLDEALPITGRWNGLGVPVRVADQPLLCAALATHLSGELFHMRLLRLIELTLVIRQDRAAGRLDWLALHDMLHDAGGLRFAYPALALVERLTPGTVDGRLLAQSRNASTRLTRHVVERFGPTAPLVPDRVSLAERLMWASGPADLLRRVALMAHPGTSASLPAAALAYYGRARRVLAGRVSWRVESAGREEERPAL